MNEKEKAEALSMALDTIIRGGDADPESADEEIRALSALGRSLDDIEFEPSLVHKAAVERLLLKHRKEMQEAVTASKEVPMTSSQESPKTEKSLRQRWLVPLALAGGLAITFVCVVVAVVGGSMAWRAFRGADSTTELTPAIVAESDVPGTEVVESDVPGTEVVDTSEDEVFRVFVPSVFNPLAPHHAKLLGVRGVVEVQTEDGVWAAASSNEILDAGQRVRTGALSSAQIAFYDGSVAYLEAETEVSLDRLEQADDQSRIVELTQWVGETDHDVAASYGANGHYEVHTPSGSGVAKGTFFHVSVTPALVVRFIVDEGAVEVTNVNVTVIVIAGQLTTINVDEPPAEPAFRVTGEGEVSEMGEVLWVIAGKVFATHDGTIIVGNPQPGDWVYVDSHLGYGTRIADYIILLYRSPANRFTITGEVEAMGTVSWTVAGQEIVIGDETDVEKDIGIEVLVHVEGLIDDGTLLAESIRRVAEPGLLTFVGVVESMTDTQWRISGISVTIDADTVIYSDSDPEPEVRDVVQVSAVLDEGAWLARSITLLLEPEYEFEFTGYVDTIGLDEWSVSGVSFVVDEWTEIEDPDKIEENSLVKVEGRILADGTWLATRIELAGDDELTFEFVGTVDEINIDSWVVSGIEVSVTDETEITGTIVVSDLVKVKGEILPDRTWLATEIKLVEDTLGEGCLQVAAIVFSADAELIVLQDGSTLPLDPETVIEGELQANSVILFYLCWDDEGNVTVVSIIVIYQLEPLIVIPVPPAEGPKVTICHKPGTPAEKTMSLPESALSGHIGHGDYLGPCEK
jgi:hypothetical protein